MELDYKVTAIYVLACVVFLRTTGGIQTAVVPKCICNAHAGEVFQGKQLSVTELQGGTCMHPASRANVNSTAESRD